MRDAVRSLALLFVVFCQGGEAIAETCPQYLAHKFAEAKTRAGACDIDEAMIGSIDNPSTKPGICRSSPQGVLSQLGAFKACSAVYYCAAEAYRCALKRVQAGEGCQSAMQRCVNDNPIPSIQ